MKSVPETIEEFENSVSKQDKSAISEVCQFICREFGSRSQSFQIDHSTLEELLNFKEITPFHFIEFIEQMSHHAYICVSWKSLLFIHYSLINSIGYMDEEIVHRFEKATEAGISGCIPVEEEDEEEGAGPPSKSIKHLH